jgi:S-adenosylmethionine synthetase
MFGYYAWRRDAGADAVSDLLRAPLCAAAVRSPQGRPAALVASDAKSQVTVRYANGRPAAIDTVVLSTQHHPSMNERQKELAEAVIDEIIKPVLPAKMLSGAKYLVNPTGRFESADRMAMRASPAARSSSTLTAAQRRTAAALFPARIRPRSIARGVRCALCRQEHVAAGLTRTPGSAFVRSASPADHRHGVTKAPASLDHKLSELVNEHFDLRPKGIIRMLNLLRPIYAKTAAYGHFDATNPSSRGKLPTRSRR